MKTNKNTISNTLLLSVIVLLSVAALSAVLIGGKKIDTAQLNVSHKSPDHTLPDNTKLLYEKSPVSGTRAKFQVDPQAIILSI